MYDKEACGCEREWMTDKKTLGVLKKKNTSETRPFSCCESCRRLSVEDSGLQEIYMWQSVTKMTFL